VFGTGIVMAVLQKHILSVISFCFSWACPTARFSSGDEKLFLELTRQTHKRRFVATGGALKDVLKLDQETDADM
ncbi:hypothetical protein ACI3SR_28825, partial [Klebsiella pneumoniae]